MVSYRIFKIINIMVGLNKGWGYMFEGRRGFELGFLCREDTAVV